MPTRRKPRRQRYVATQRDGTTIDVLAYSLEGARKACHQNGVFPTDLRLKTNAVARQMNGGGWRLNNAALTVVKRELGLTLPVLIKQTGRVGNQRGGYSLRMDESGRLYHHITMKNYENAEQANKTLRHELRHAWQAEQVIAKCTALGSAGRFAAWEKYVKGQHTWSYESRPIEVDANRYAARPSTISLALPNRC